MDASFVAFFQIAVQTVALAYLAKKAFDTIYQRLQTTMRLTDDAITTATETIEDVSTIAFEAQTMIKEATKVLNKMSEQVPALVKESRHYINEARQRRSSVVSMPSTDRLPMQQSRDNLQDHSPDPPETRLCCFTS